MAGNRSYIDLTEKDDQVETSSIENTSTNNAAGQSTVNIYSMIQTVRETEMQRQKELDAKLQAYHASKLSKLAQPTAPTNLISNEETAKIYHSTQETNQRFINDMNNQLENAQKERMRLCKEYTNLSGQLYDDVRNQFQQKMQAPISQLNNDENDPLQYFLNDLIQETSEKIQQIDRVIEALKKSPYIRSSDNTAQRVQFTNFFHYVSDSKNYKKIINYKETYLSNHYLKGYIFGEKINKENTISKTDVFKILNFLLHTCDTDFINSFWKNNENLIDLATSLSQEQYSSLIQFIHKQYQKRLITNSLQNNFYLEVLRVIPDNLITIHSKFLKSLILNPPEQDKSSELQIPIVSTYTSSFLSTSTSQKRKLDDLYPAPEIYNHNNKK